MPGYLLHDVLTPFGGQLWFLRPTMGGAESLLRGSLSAHADLRWFLAC